MPMYAAEPNRSEPDRTIWFCVETPGAFREYELPACTVDWTVAHWRRFRELERLADLHQTRIQRNSYRRG